MWRRWKRSGDAAVKEQHRNVDRRIKREARRYRRRFFNDVVTSLSTVQAGQALATMGRMLKARTGNRKRNAPAVRRIQPSEFTNFVATQHPSRAGDGTIHLTPFELDQSWETSIEEAILRAPRNKDVGGEEVFAELLCSWNPSASPSFSPRCGLVVDDYAPFRRNGDAR